MLLYVSYAFEVINKFQFSARFIRCAFYNFLYNRVTMGMWQTNRLNTSDVVKLFDNQPLNYLPANNKVILWITNYINYC